MTVFESQLSSATSMYKDNRQAMLECVAELRVLESRAVAASNRRRETFRKRGQLTPHERVQRLLDPGMPFLRLHTLANYLLQDSDPDKSIPGGSVILGIGFVSGTRCMIWADDSGISAGALTPGGATAALNVQEMALRLKSKVRVRT